MIAFHAQDQDSVNVGSIIQIGDMHYPQQVSYTVGASDIAWIIKNRITHRIGALCLPGDVTYNNSDAEWDSAATLLRQLDGIIPYDPTVGNHDAAPTTRNTRRNVVFDSATMPWLNCRTTGRPSDSTYYTTGIANRKFLFLNLEFAPRTSTVLWADSVLKQYPDHVAIVSTHAFLYNDSTRYDYAGKGESQTWSPHSAIYADWGIGESVYDGEELWGKPFEGQPNGLINGNSNVLMVLCGHVLGSGRGNLTSVRSNGTKCHQVLFNTQIDDVSIRGSIRRYKFDFDRNVISVTTLLPSLSAFMTDAANQFSLEM